jgi:hypothetical protein
MIIVAAPVAAPLLSVSRVKYRARHSHHCQVMPSSLMTQLRFAVGWVDSRGKERLRQNDLSKNQNNRVAPVLASPFVLVSCLSVKTLPNRISLNGEKIIRTPTKIVHSTPSAIDAVTSPDGLNRQPELAAQTILTIAAPTSFDDVLSSWSTKQTQPDSYS